MRKNRLVTRRNVRKSKQALVESIMAKVRPIVENVLNESVLTNIDLEYYEGECYYGIAYPMNKFDILSDEEVDFLNDNTEYTELFDKLEEAEMALYRLMRKMGRQYPDNTITGEIYDNQYDTTDGQYYLEKDGTITRF